MRLLVLCSQGRNEIEKLVHNETNLEVTKQVIESDYIGNTAQLLITSNGANQRKNQMQDVCIQQTVLPFKQEP